MYGKWKIGAAAGTLILLCCLGGCGKTADRQEKLTALSFAKNGSVVSTIRTDFDPGYYDQEELKSMTLAEVSAYNQAKGENAISVDKLEQENGFITVVMKYATAQDYSAFNNKELFCGTVAQAYDEGYPLDVSLAAVKDNEDVIGREDLLNMGERHLLIAAEPLRVETFGKILYASQGVQISSGRKLAQLPADAEGLSYLLFQ